MKKCINCGKSIDDLDARCPYCDEKQSVKNTKSMYEDAYDEFYKDFYSRAKGNENTHTMLNSDEYDRKKKRKNKNKKKKLSNKEEVDKLNKTVGIVIMTIFILSLFLSTLFVGAKYTYMSKDEFNESDEFVVIDVEEYYEGADVNPDFQFAYDYLKEKELRNGITIERRYLMAKMLMDNKVNKDKGVDNNQGQAASILKELASENYPDAQFDLAEYYFNNYKESKYYIKDAIKLLKKCSITKPEAYFYLGRIYEEGKKYGIKTDEKMAIVYYRRGVKEDEPKCKTVMGHKYIFDYKIVGKDVKKGIKLLRSAAHSENGTYASFYLGKLYYEGKEVKKDLKYAKNFFRNALRNNNDEKFKKVINGYINKIDKKIQKKKK